MNITRALKWLDEEDAEAAIAISVSEVTLTPEIDELSKQIKKKLKEANTLDLEGKTYMKIRALEVVDELRTKRADKQADVETDEVYAQMTLQSSTPQEQKDTYHPVELGVPSRQPTNYFCKTLSASDTATHGGFSVPRRAEEKVSSGFLRHHLAKN